jgi:threonine dehydratase
MPSLPTLHDAYRAQQRIRSLIWETPLWAAPDLATRTGAARVHLKLECLQHTGAFKVRGAANRILSLSEAEKHKGVITFSTGNHGKAVAFVAGKTGIRAVVCLSAHVPAYRAEMIRALGAELSIQGHSQDAAEENYRRLAAERGLTPVVPFDDPHIVAGQGTIALEILQALPDTDVLVVQLSGGGLLGGIAMVAKSINPAIRVVGVSLERSPAMLESLKAGAPVPVEEKDSVADSLLGGIGFQNHYTLPLVERFVDAHVLIAEAPIKEAMYYLFDRHRLVVEGAAAVGVAALLQGILGVAGRRVVALLSGSTVDSAAYLRILQEGSGAAGALHRDPPGKETP